MCSICGFIMPKNKTISLEEFTSLNESMAHRGRDDHGEIIGDYSEGYSIGLAHRRLSIIDLSKDGHQPMASADGMIELVFNGEIYNFLELKKELVYDFKSNSDTEVIIASYLKWGIDCLSHFNGMFAFALYDKRTNKVILARDRFGKKPIYIYNDGKVFFFSSELKPIIYCTKTIKKINCDAISTFIFNQYISSPDCIIENVTQLSPGCYLEYSNGNVSTECFWNPIDEYCRLKDTQNDYFLAKKHLNEVLVEAVKYRLISDVPLGCFLSGGIDSSLVTAIASRLTDYPINTYTIGFEDPEYNEAPYAKEIAKFLGTKHHELIISEEEMFDMINDKDTFFDEPFSDESMIPTMLVSKLASNDVKVVLSGDGGDELFCGYTHYDTVKRLQQLDPILNIAYYFFKAPIFSHIYNKLPNSYKSAISHRDKHFKVQYGGDSYIEIINEIMNRANYGCRFNDERCDIKNWQVRRMLLDICHYLPSDILTKMDRASMKYTLEARNPLLDVNVANVAFSMIHSFKYHNGEKKYILKDVLSDYIPRELIDRPKRGFSVPIDKWLRTWLKESVKECASVPFLKEQGFFSPDYTHSFIEKYLETGNLGKNTGKNYSSMVWSFYCFQTWWQKYGGYFNAD